jgi:hypothetical protein
LVPSLVSFLHSAALASLRPHATLSGFLSDFMFQLMRAEFDSGGTVYRAYAFTEHGALQAANVLRSPRAVQMSVFVIRAFVKMRETLLGTRELSKKLAILEQKLTARLDVHEATIVASSARSNASSQPAASTALSTKAAHWLYT